MIDATTDDGVRALTSLYELPKGPTVRVNLIVTPGGDLTGPDSTSGSLSNPTDRLLVRLLRKQSDAVIIGAETLRRERIPLPADTPLIVLTSTGKLPWGNLIGDPATDQVVVMTDNPGRDLGAPPGLSPRVVALEPGGLHPDRIIELCRGEGWTHLLVEGGKKTATSFAASDLVDDLCLTLTGPPALDTSPPVSWWPRFTPWETKHLLTDDTRMLFHRFTRTPQKP